MSKPVFSDLFSFSGRRNRKSFVLYALVVFVISLILNIALGAALFDPTGTPDLSAPLIILILISIPFMVSGLAVLSQRVRDFGWTGWAVLIVLIPFVGGLFYIACFFIPGTKGENRYGPDPLGDDSAEAFN